MAIADYTEAIRIKPDYASAYNNRGNAYGDLGQHDKAIFDLTQAIRINPDDANAYHNRNLAYQKQGKKDLAEADRAKAKELGYKPPE